MTFSSDKIYYNFSQKNPKIHICNMYVIRTLTSLLGLYGRVYLREVVVQTERRRLYAL